MKSSAPLTKPVKVRELLRRRLREIGRSPAELAAAVQVPPEYIDDLIAGRRRPPLPGRTDLYERMTSFLKLGRNDLALCARAERGDAENGGGAHPPPAVRRLLLELCEPATARALDQRRTKSANERLTGLFARLLDVAQGAVRRVLEDQVTLRVAAERSGTGYLAMRLKVLEFLDATPDTLTPAHVTDFLRPRVALWDVDLESGVLRVVLRSQEPRHAQRRRPAARTAF